MKIPTTIWCIATLLSVVLFTNSLYAQGVTTAAINGKVTTQNGEALPGVNVVAVHEPSGTKYGTSTREDGRYTLPNLRVGGPYTVTASIIGYQKQATTQIYLRLSENLDLNFTMTEEAVQAGEVVVTGERTSVFNSSRTGAATNVTREQIDRLPTLTRNFQDYYRLSPYFSGSASGSAVGRNSKYNNIQIDGGDFNDLFGLGSTGAPAGQSTVTPISLDALEEFQIVISPYDVRQAGFTGAGINAITRSGTNSSKGSLFYFGRSQDFVGKTPTDVDSLRKKLDGFRDWQYGFRVGGPIVENTLFYFVNAEVTRFSQPLTRTFGNAGFGTNAFTVSQDSLDLLTNTLKARYGYDPGAWSGFSFIRESEKIFLRSDYNLSQSHKLTARYSYLHSLEDNTPSRGRGPTDLYSEFGRYELENKTHSIGLQLNSVFGNTASNEFIIGYVDQFDKPFYLGKAFPQLVIGTSAGGTGNQNLILGAEEFRHYNELGQKYWEITDNFSYYLPGHTLTLGAKVDIFKFRNLFIPDGFGQYAYSSILRFLQGLPPDGAPGFSAYTFRYSATSDPQQEANWGARQFGIYAQDEWTATPSLKFTFGVRLDIPTYPDKPNYNGGIDTVFGYRTDVLPKTYVAFSPRVGFNWAMDEERSAQLRGGVGIFSGRFPYVWVSNQYSNTGVDFYTVTRAPSSFIADPYGQPKSATSLPTAEVDLTAPNFKAPSIIRTNLAFDYKLPYDIVATVEGIYSKTQDDIVYQNINLKAVQTNGGLTPNGRIPGENREVWGRWDTVQKRYSTQWVDNRFSPGVFLISNTSKGYNANIIVQLQRNVDKGLSGSAAYTWGIAKDINSGNSTTASSGWRFNPTPGNPNEPQLTYSQWDRRHRIAASLSYREDWAGSGFATTIGIFYSGQSGRPFSYMVTGDVNGDGRSDNDLAYIPRDENDIILVSSSGAPLAKTDPAYAQLFAFINNDDYLSSHKGQIAERSGAREPWSHQIDLHFGQEIPTYQGQRFEITLDVVNLLNLLNSKWGWVKTTGNNQTFNLLRFNSLDPATGRARYQWQVTTADPFLPDDDPRSVLGANISRWRAQLGLRYSF